MDGKMLARLGAVVFVAIAVTATAIDMARKDEPSAPPPAPAFQPPADPLRETLRRCQQLGDAAASDADCLAAWAQSRDRFLGRPSTPATPQASEGR
ncbi:putative entry exclusion protein TrbK-alt [Paracoccus sp. SSJ]|uniref:putative entry exclusion protein TrbK-alt n=1 Tax=Paracoccus sp. SSJ TaxID=3050636 RepID=UPI002549EFE5|nr:putative entry exclusion protein TrbK-alt [Paracoccus sp. SSJ]MDK8874658.1 putative entry exclusion protein TrbK-alt [Paracoccus sp. SSJ]